MVNRGQPDDERERKQGRPQQTRLPMKSFASQPMQPLQPTQPCQPMQPLQPTQPSQPSTQPSLQTVSFGEKATKDFFSSSANSDDSLSAFLQTQSDVS
eukprot:gene24447-10454_t